MRVLRDRSVVQQPDLNLITRKRRFLLPRFVAPELRSQLVVELKAQECLIVLDRCHQLRVFLLVEQRAGDVLGSGTCGNGGCLAELWGRRGQPDPPPLRPGDVVELTVEGIGQVRNRVVPGVELPAVAPARPRPRLRQRPAVG